MVQLMRKAVESMACSATIQELEKLTWLAGWSNLVVLEVVELVQVPLVVVLEGRAEWEV